VVAREYVDVIERSRNLSVMAFHEKAGRSQVGSLFFLVSNLFLPTE
jgi:hypothetical protein